MGSTSSRTDPRVWNAESGNLLVKFGQHFAYHVIPLHYVPFIARDRRLFCKDSLRDVGFPDFHFRSTSHRTDVRRGFGSVVHSSSSARPPILDSKLCRGYPHVVIAIPLHMVPESGYLLCRYNIARNRGRFDVSGSSGTLRSPFKIPVAQTLTEKQAMLQEFGDSLLEILFLREVELLQGTTVEAFHEEDAFLVRRILSQLDVSWETEICSPPGDYPRRLEYVSRVREFVHQAMADPRWKGFPLEFDR